jgi:hypothetical protein
MRHLTTRHDIALCILHNLGRGQRRRLGGDGYRVHDADHGILFLTLRAPGRETFVLRTVVLQYLLHAAGKCGRHQGGKDALTMRRNGAKRDISGVGGPA